MTDATEWLKLNKAAGIEGRDVIGAGFAQQIIDKIRDARPTSKGIPITLRSREYTTKLFLDPRHVQTGHKRPGTQEDIGDRHTIWLHRDAIAPLEEAVEGLKSKAAGLDPCVTAKVPVKPMHSWRNSTIADQKRYRDRDPTQT